MERLTKRFEHKNADGIKYLPNNQETVFAMLNKLGELEDLEEQGLLLRLPCKVGDTLYQVIADINEYKVTAIEIYEGKVVICADNLDTGIGFSFCAERIGRRYFLTKAEAEKALAEMG